MGLGRFIDLPNWLGFFLGPGLGCELLLHLERDGVRVYLVDAGSIAQFDRRIPRRSS